MVRSGVSLREHEIVVTGASGFLGRAVMARLAAIGVPAERVHAPRSTDFDLRDAARCRMMFDAALGGALGDGGGRPALVIHCAGFVGGLGLNRMHPARMFHDNLLMALNVTEAACRAGVPRGGGGVGGGVVLVGSMTSYPAGARVPMREEDLFTGLPEAEIASYGVAKLAQVQMLRAYGREHGLRGACPILSNLYGPGDNVDDPLVAHAAGALMKRFADAAREGTPEVVCWGTGAPTRDFLFVDDAAAGVVRVAEHLAEGGGRGAEDGGGRGDGGGGEPLVVNLASGTEVSLRELAETLARLTGFGGKVTWDASKGDGVARRSLDITRAREVLGWAPGVSLEEGLRRTVAWYRSRGAVG